MNPALRGGWIDSGLYLMATDYYIGWTMADKLALLRGVQNAATTGNVVRVQTAVGVETTFDPKSTSPDVVLERIQYSIVNDPNFDADDPVQAALARNGRAGITRGRFC